MRGTKCRSNLPDRGRQSGYLLLPVAVAIALIGVIAFLINSQSAIEVDLTAGELETARAEYVAQAGLQHALRQHAQQGCGPYADLTKVAFGVDEYDTKLTHDLKGTATYNALTDQDTWIRSDFTTNNYATDTKLHIRFETGIIERPLYRYDLSAIPVKAAILSATAHFYVSKAHPEGPVDIHLVTADWLETDATWDTMGDKIDPVVIASIPAQASVGWVEVNLTSHVQAWINGVDNYGITLNSTSEGTHGDYGSRESATESYIEIIVGDPPTSPAKLNSTSKIDGGGAASIKRDIALQQSPLSYVRLALDSGTGQDAMIDSFYNTRNYGNHALDIDSDGTLEHALLKFDSLKVPRGARIVSARLELYHTVTDGTPADPRVEVHRVTRDWVEGTKDGSGTADGVTWDTWDGSNNWSQGGGDFDASPVASSAISTAVNDWESWDITQLVQGWVDGNIPNFGLLLRGTGTIEATFASKEDADPSLRPRLDISYSCQCGTVCAAPQGSGNILMAVVSPTVLVAEDQKARDLFESWGYTVSIISESANQASYDTAVAAADVVFISETVNSNSVGTKLAGAPIGVVSQDGDYNPDLGLASGNGFKVGADTSITSNDHYITRPFATGPLKIYTAAMEQAIVGGSLTAEQQVLADIANDGSLVVLEAGAAMEGGGTAAGRRAILPLGTRYRFNWDHLNANGRLLVHRALEWGIGADSKGAGKLLLVVANAGSLLTSESDRKALIESWGYDVTLISDDAPQAEYDTALAEVDVVYICGSGSSTAVGTKLTAATVGVLSEDIGLVDELGIAEPLFVKKNSQQINVIDNTHYVTSGFGLGALQLYTYLPEIWTVTGALAPGLNILGETQDGVGTFPPGLAYLETGAALYGGGFAAGRRVQMPWSEGSFDINSLNDDGRTIFRRAIEWGTGATSAPLPSRLLFVVPSPGSLGAVDAAKQALFESWDYTVNLIDDDAPLSDFVAATLANDVVYVSATAVASSVGSKLFKAPIGVVNANSGLHDDFGFSTVRYITTANATLDTVANHYITQPFGGGTVTLFTSDQLSGGAVGTLAADLDQIGLWSSGGLSTLGGLVTLETGAMTSIGENTPGRRAQMPWDNLDVSTLSADGLTILQRSLEWAGGANIDLGPLAHWKLDETSGFTAVDSEGGHDGTLTNYSTPTWTGGVVDGGLEFDGNDDHVRVGHSTDFELADGTIIMWLNAVDVAAEQYLFFKDGADKVFLLLKSGEITYETNGDTLTAPAVADDWTQVAVTFGAGGMSLYLDGALVASNTKTDGMMDNTGDLFIGSDNTGDKAFDGILDDVRIYDRALGADEIADLYAASAPPEPGYYELFQPWSAANDDTWEAFDLGAFGVPANAVVEVALINTDTNKEQWAGVRAVGSSLERRFQLHEAEGDGGEVITLHVQADAGSQIQHYTSKKGETSFVLLGYWNTGSYTELFDSFTASDDGEWRNQNLGSVGVGPNQVAEIVIQNTDGGAERLAGVRTPGLGLERRIDLHKAEAGGVEAVSMMVNTDASSTVQVYAQTVSDIDFHVVGFWATPPGTYTETGGVHIQALTANAWHPVDPGSVGVPADSIAQFVMSNEVDNFEREMGMRSTGSSLDRFIDLHEAEGGGSDVAGMHVNIDSTPRFEVYVEAGTTERYFYPVGWWVLP